MKLNKKNLKDWLERHSACGPGLQELDRLIVEDSVQKKGLPGIFEKMKRAELSRKNESLSWAYRQLTNVCLDRCCSGKLSRLTFKRFKEEFESRTEP